ncbi:hypothetical protein [Rhodococcus koreensis]
MTWILWIGALLVISGAGALLKGRTMVARRMWLLAMLTFVVVLIRAFTAPVVSLALVITVALAIVMTLVLVAFTAPQKKGQAATVDTRS